MLAEMTFFGNERSALDVRQGQLLNYEALREEVQKAVESSRESQAQIARAIGKNPSQVNRAIKNAGTTYLSIQMEIIQYLTPYTLHDEGGIRVFRKELN